MRFGGGEISLATRARPMWPNRMSAARVGVLVSLVLLAGCALKGPGWDEVWNRVAPMVHPPAAAMPFASPDSINLSTPRSFGLGDPFSKFLANPHLFFPTDHQGSQRALASAVNIEDKRPESGQKELLIPLLPPDHPLIADVEIRGKRWPMVRNEGTGQAFPAQEGITSYYWRKQPLASGGWFNPNAMTAAHKTLPFGTVVRCTRLDTGESVVVMINDRGPFIKDRVIDLSRAAAKKLDLLKKGLVPCRLDVLAYPLIETMGPKGNG